MRIKKACGKVYGADLTAAERKAMNLEIQRQLTEYTTKHWLEIDAAVLWVLHTQLGWGAKRLRRFHDQFNEELEALLKRYEIDENEQTWLCTNMLKKLGVDIEQWDREKG